MAKTRPKDSKSSKKDRNLKSKDILSGTIVPTRRKPQPVNASSLLGEAAVLLQTGQPDAALPIAQQALSLLSASGSPTPAALPALSLIGEIQVEIGDAPSALETFQAVVSLDPEGSLPENRGAGAEPFLWLAQLCEGGGKESIQWFECGVKVLERDITALESQKGREQEIEEKRRKLAAAICGIIEVWMTDLSLEPEAESQCESLITRALLISHEPYPQTLQTLASIRLSQSRLEDAQSALTRSLESWKDLPAVHSDIPDFSTRVSLSRLLMEAEMEDIALEVVERLVGEDDHSIEAWYLGGWCLWLMGNKTDEESATENGADSDRNVLLMSSREWLRNCLKLYGLLDYEDEKLKEHAMELVVTLDKELGDAEIEDDSFEEWEDEDTDEDHDMNGT